MTAILVKNVSYQKDGVEIVIDAGELVVIDVEKSVLYLNGDHVDIYRDEYSLAS